MAGVEVLQLRDVVGAPGPRNAGQVNGVVEPEVVERTQQAAFERVPQAEFHGDAPVEPLENALPVGAFGRGGEAEEDLRAEMLQKTAIGRGGRMVELVHHDDVEGVGWNGGQVHLRQ